MKRQPPTFIDHVHELRLRLLVSGLAFLIGGGIGYLLHKPLLAALDNPLHQTLYYTTPAGVFNLIMKLAVMVGICFLLPVATYNVIAFVQPALERRLSKRQVRIVTLLSVVLALGGAAFAFYVVVPMSLSFFNGFKISGIHSLITANDYLNFVTNCIISFIVIFQMPLVVLFIDRIKRLPPRRFLHYERHVVVGSLLIALVLPFTYDPVTEFLIALPMIGLYNLSIIFVLFAHRSERKKQKRQQPAKVRTAAVDHVFQKPVAIPAAARPKPLLRPMMMDVVSRPAAQVASRPIVYQKRVNFLDLRKPDLGVE